MDIDLDFDIDFTDDVKVIDSVSADTIEVGDQIVVDGDYVEVKGLDETLDPDEVVVTGYSHNSGDRVMYSLYADDYYEIWTV